MSSEKSGFFSDRNQHILGFFIHENVMFAHMELEIIQSLACCEFFRVSLHFANKKFQSSMHKEDFVLAKSEIHFS